MRPAFIALILAVLSVPAGASDVSGQVALPSNRVARDAVVYLEGEAKSVPLAHAMVDQRRKAFIPHVSVITQGTTVEFPNNDTVFHNVFAVFEAKRFDLGLYPKGTVRRKTFEKSGIVALLCNIHSEMSAYIMVVNTPYYAVTDAQGKFTIRGVKPGSYRLHVWHETGASLNEALKVSGGPTTLDLKLVRN